MSLGHTIKRLEVGDEVKITTEESEYAGTVAEHRYTESRKDPISPWYDPGGASAFIDLDDSTIDRLNLNQRTLQIYCGQFDDYPAWKPPVASLYEDDKERDELGEVTDIQLLD